MDRTIKLLTVKVWPDGVTADELADHLEHVATMLRQGYHSGEVYPSDGRGWWDTFETEKEDGHRSRQKESA